MSRIQKFEDSGESFLILYQYKKCGCPSPILCRGKFSDALNLIWENFGIKPIHDGIWNDRWDELHYKVTDNFCAEFFRNEDFLNVQIYAIDAREFVLVFYDIYTNLPSSVETFLHKNDAIGCIFSHEQEFLDRGGVLAFSTFNKNSGVLSGSSSDFIEFVIYKIDLVLKNNLNHNRADYN